MAASVAQTVTFPVEDRSALGYLAVPEQQSGPGVLVLHAWWGLNAVFTGICDRLAQEGFVALAPDLYHGQVATTIEEAKNRQSALDGDTVYQEIMSAIAFLQANPQTAGAAIGVVGFSMGGAWALVLEEPVVAIVTFYGLTEPEHVTAHAAFLGHFAEHDEFAPPAEVEQLATHLRMEGKDAAFFTYPGTQHWFFEADRLDVYNPQAAQLAWARTLDFLRQYLPTA